MSPLRSLSLGAALLLAAAGPAAAKVIVVNTLEGTSTTNGNCSLREALDASWYDYAVDGCAGGGPGTDLIVFTVTGTIAWPQGYAVQRNVVIQGPGADRLTIDGGGSANGYNSLFLVGGTNTTLTIRGVTLTGGALNLTSGGAIEVSSSGGAQRALVLADCRVVGNTAYYGGAIDATRSTVTIDRCHFDGNSSRYGGAIRARGAHLTITNSTFSGNVAESAGGAIDFMYDGGQGAFGVSRSTFSGNSTNGTGGALQFTDGSPNLEVILHSTFTENVANADAGGLSGHGGAIALTNGNNFRVQNSIFARNEDRSPNAPICPDLLGHFVSGGHNLVGQPGFYVGQPGNLCTDDFVNGQNGDLVGTFGSSIDPVLSALGNYGGPAPTHVLLAGSPASDAGACAGERHDQRGYYNPATNLRPVDGLGPGSACDIGATEQLAARMPTVTLAPVGGLPVVVARGQRLRFSATFTRSSSGPTSVRYRTEAVLPNGTVRPLIPLTTIQVASGAGTTVSFQPRVPQAAPLGGYLYRIYVETTDGTVRATDFFPFEVTAASPREAALAGDEALAGAGELAAPGADGAEAAPPASAEALPEAATLAAPHPNPLSSRATLGFALLEATGVRLAVYDALGREVAVLVDERREAGTHAVAFDAAGLAAGAYLVRLDAGGVVVTRRVTVLR